MNMSILLIVELLLLSSISLPMVMCDCSLEYESSSHGHQTHQALLYKIIALASILIAGGLGICLPIMGLLNPNSKFFLMIKAFVGGVILSTGCMHVLPDAFENLNSPCLNEKITGYPWPTFIMMMSCISTFMLDTFAKNYYKKEDGLPVGAEDQATDSSTTSDLIRHKVVSQVLEFGIVVHSVIIGISLGASHTPSTIKPLIVALSFHQFFEGMGLGGCIFQAELKKKAITLMVVFFSLTTPIGITIGIGISNFYNENNPKSLLIEGVFNAASAGILIFMALVDLLAADFENPKLQASGKLQVGAFILVFVGAGCMALLAIWA